MPEVAPRALLLTDWYELVSGRELMQGDFLEGCPVFRPPADLTWPVSQERSYQFVATSLDVVIMSQSCDLVEGQKSEMTLVLLCPIWTLSAAARENSFLNSN